MKHTIQKKIISAILLPLLLISFENTNAAQVSPIIAGTAITTTSVVTQGSPTTYSNTVFATPSSGNAWKVVQSGSPITQIIVDCKFDPPGQHFWQVTTPSSSWTYSSDTNDLVGGNTGGLVQGHFIAFRPPHESIYYPDSFATGFSFMTDFIADSLEIQLRGYGGQILQKADYTSNFYGTFTQTSVVPTLSEWGLIILGSTLLGFGIYIIKRRQGLMMKI